LLISIALGNHENRRDVSIVPCTRVSVVHGGLIAAQIDGERMAAPPTEIRLSRESLNIIVPHGSSLARDSAEQTANHRADIRPESISRR
jgi:diacylglycerol kinase family enzyme